MSGVLPGDHRDAGVACALRRAWLRGDRRLTGAPDRDLTLKGEGRYHMINDTRAGHDPSGLAVTGGLKKYF